MLPIKTSATEPGCVPSSSDCVIWQGPNIPCINLCTGDSISDVTFKIAEKLCAIQGAYDLSSLQLSDLATFCTSIAGPPTGTNKTLLAVLDYIVKKLACVNTKVDTLPPGTSFTEPSLALPSCLQYTDLTTQQLVTQLIHNQYTLRLGNQYCSLKTIVDGNYNTILNHSVRILALENASAPTLPTVRPNCSYPGINANTPTAMNVLLDAVEEDLCNLRAAVGTNSQITSAASQLSNSLCSTISNNLNNAQALSQATGTTMSGAYASKGWQSTVANLSQSIQNLWITVLDMRCVINDLKNCCGQVDCSKFILDFTVTPDNTRQNVTLNFVGKMSFPGTGFTNATGTNASKITISDGINTITVNNVDLISLLTNNSGLVIPVAGSGVSGALETSRSYTITVFGTILKDGTSCNKSVVKYSYPGCPQIILVSP